MFVFMCDCYPSVLQFVSYVTKHWLRQTGWISLTCLALISLFSIFLVWFRCWWKSELWGQHQLSQAIQFSRFFFLMSLDYYHLHFPCMPSSSPTQPLDLWVKTFITVPCIAHWKEAYVEKPVTGPVLRPCLQCHWIPELVTFLTVSLFVELPIASQHSFHKLFNHVCCQWQFIHCN